MQSAIWLKQLEQRGVMLSLPAPWQRDWAHAGVQRRLFEENCSECTHSMPIRVRSSAGNKRLHHEIDGPSCMEERLHLNVINPLRKMSHWHVALNVGYVCFPWCTWTSCDFYFQMKHNEEDVVHSGDTET